MTSGAEPLFVLGPQKTGTSTLVGILDCHPEILVLYETGLDRAFVSKYGNRLLAGHPEARRFFRRTADVGEPYRGLAGYLEARDPGRRYRYVGDKVIGLDPEATQRGGAYRTVFALRDLRSWLCKGPIVGYYRTDLDVVPAAVDFLRYVIGTCRVENGLRVRLEDLIGDNDRVLARLSAFLELDLVDHADRWWERIGRYAEGDPKGLLGWHQVHASSNLPPRAMDTSVDLAPHPFWEAVLPLQARYGGEVQTGDLPADEIERDLAGLEDLMRFSPLSLAECYRDVDTRRLRSPGSTGLVARVLRRLGRVKQAAFGATVLR